MNESTFVPAGMRVKSGAVYDRKDFNGTDLFFNAEDWARRLNEMKEPIEKRPRSD